MKINDPPPPDYKTLTPITNKPTTLFKKEPIRPVEINSLILSDGFITITQSCFTIDMLKNLMSLQTALIIVSARFIPGPFVETQDGWFRIPCLIL
ncbi:MAG: hypothetical protein WKI04_09590 [Ferruginibacter sp.]